MIQIINSQIILKAQTTQKSGPDKELDPEYTTNLLIYTSNQTTINSNSNGNAINLPSLAHTINILSLQQKRTGIQDSS